MLRLKAKDLFVYFIATIKCNDEEEFIDALNDFLFYDTEDDQKIAKCLEIGTFQLEYLKKILMEQMTIKYLESENPDSFITSVLSEEFEQDSYVAFQNFEDRELLKIIANYAKLINQDNAKYSKTCDFKECIYDIFEVILKEKDELMKTIETSQKRSIKDSLYSEFLSSDEDDDDDYFDEDEDNDDYYYGDEEEFDSYSFDDEVYDKMMEIINKYYPNHEDRKKFINSIISSCYASLKQYNHVYADICVMPDFIESDCMKNFNSLKDTKEFLVQLFSEMLSTSFLENGININAANNVTVESAIEVYKKYDPRKYKEIINNQKINVFIGKVDDIIDAAILAYHNGLEDEEFFEYLDPSCVLDKTIKYLHYDMQAGKLFDNHFKYCLNVNAKRLLNDYSIRRVISKFLEYINYHKAELDSKTKIIYDELLLIKNADTKSIYNIFAKYGEQILKTYVKTFKEEINTSSKCRKKIYEDGLLDQVLKINPAAYSEYVDIVEFKNIESVINSKYVLKILGDLDNTHESMREQFNDYSDYFGHGLNQAILSVLTIVYENMLCDEEKDEKLIKVIEETDVNDLIELFLEDDELFEKIIYYLKKYINEDFSIEQELECRKKDNVRQKINIISRLNPYFQMEKRVSY